MEANRKRNRGFLKGKILPFYRAPKPSSTMQYTTTKVNTNHSSSPASIGCVVHQDYAISQPNPKVSIVVADNRSDLVSHLEELYGLPGDESVDTKAGLYISMVQQRLTLERVSTEPKC
ncbi:PREDICTED: uncharacterized protein LOC109358067 [Lupinus angustifolius]|uniref:uncharacterized protein LOC109358067 n=1 Tax=Lupinus angustifolius TaxID=3871 RepID=UPI00092FCBF9|nr:PREDICTED: uncharacterized protein LOC109358067 [Lupinus angustifolius]